MREVWEELRAKLVSFFVHLPLLGWFILAVLLYNCAYEKAQQGFCPKPLPTPEVRP